MKRILAASLAMAFATPAFAEGDAEAGEKVFNKCKSCHMIVADDGTEIVKGGRTGPNLWGMPGRVIASVEDFRYGDIKQVAEQEDPPVWDMETFVAYVADPRSWVREATGDSKAKSKMSFKLTKEDEQADVWAYIVSVSPEVEMMEEEGEAADG